MRNRFFTLLAACFAGMTAFAGDWVEPTISAPSALSASELVSGHQYYVKSNVADLYIGYGLGWYSWATSSVMVEEAGSPLVYTLTETEDGWTFLAYDNGTYTFVSGTNDDNSTDTYAGELHYDMGSQGHNYFEITENGTNIYRIRIVSDDDTYGVDADVDYYTDKYWGYVIEHANLDAETLYGGFNGICIWPFCDPSSSEVSCDWQLLDVTDYYARLELYDALVESEDYSTLVDNSSASAVYNNSSSTLDEIRAAAEELASQIFNAKVYAVLDGASTSDPKDGTSLITNADFSAASIDGWDCTFVSGTTATNVGYQSASYTGTTTYTDINGDEVYPTCSQFIEAWSASGYQYGSTDVSRSIGDAELSQTLVGLPAGMYQLGCDAIASYQDDSSITVSGVQLFATGGDIDVYTSIATANGVPEHFTLTFVNDGDSITLGLRTVSSTANWIAADNFTLLYYGEVDDPYKAILDQNVSTYEALYPDLDEVYANADVKAAYEEALAAAKSATSDFLTYSEALTEAGTALTASVSEYATVVTEIEYINTLSDTAEEYEWADLVDNLADYRDNLEAAYYDGTLTSEQIAAMEDDVANMVADYISENCQAGDDISLLISNNDFDTGFSGWTVVSGTTPSWGGMDVENNLGTGATLATINSGNAEVYHATFDIAQTITNVPAGLYTLSCQAFERDDNSAGIEAELYASINGEEQTQTVKDLYDEGSEELLYQYSESDTWNVALSATLNDGTTAYVPNTMCSANVYFYEGYYKNSFNFILTDKTDVTIGIRTTSSGDWVLFDTFRLVYQGNEASVYNDYIKELIAELQEAEDGGIVASDVDAQAQEAIGAAEEALDADDADACITAIAALKAAITAVEECIALVDDLQYLYDYTNEIRIIEVESSYDGLGDLLEEVNSALENEEFESVDQISQYMLDLKKEYTIYAQYDYLDATEDNPADISSVILTAESVDSEGEASTYGWEATNDASVGSGDGVLEIYNQEAEAGFEQTIYGLAAGYYVLGVQGFYRGTGYISTIDASEENDTLPHYADLYAGDTATRIVGIYSDAATYHVDVYGGEEGSDTYYVPTGTGTANDAFENDLYHNYVVFEVAEGQETVTIGLKKTGYVSADWLVWDNWTLSYIGSTAPEGDLTTAITQIESAADATSTAATIYDLTGRRVSKAVKGVYIINGKKVLVK